NPLPGPRLVPWCVPLLARRPPASTRARALGLAPPPRRGGGALALGPPLGAPGALLLGPLVAALARRPARRALLPLCLGGGLGVAPLLARVSPPARPPLAVGPGCPAALLGPVPPALRLGSPPPPPASRPRAAPSARAASS
ncbi:hypothetical protein C3R44_22995, partial [Mycobacterium tuberculosis]